MFYEPRHGKAAHGLPHDPFKAIVAPRPIGWISTLNAAGGVNLAPYSFFNALAAAPPVVMFSHNGGRIGDGGYDGRLKDSARNAEAQGEFVHSVATWALREQMNLTSAPLPEDGDEFDHAGLTKGACRLVKPPRVAESPIALECRFLQRIDLPCTDGGQNVMILGEVVGVHIDDAALRDGRVDYGLLQPIARLGYLDYAVVNEVFAMKRPPGAG